MANPETAAAPDSAIARMKGSRKGPLIAAAVCGVLAIAAIAFFALRSSGGDKGSASKAYGALWGCMAGEPLADGENLETRFRSIRAVVGEKADWPGSCEKPLQAFYATLGDDAKSDGVRQLMDLELKCAERCSAETLVGKLGQLDEVVRGAGIVAEGAKDAGNAPPRLHGRPMTEKEFAPLVAGNLTVQGMTSIGDQRTALLLRDAAGDLHLCEIEPDADKSSRCGPIKTPVRPSSARLVENKPASLIYGVTKMGTTPEETEHGVFDAWTGQATEDDPKSVTFASDRPRLPPATKTWFEGQLDGVKLKLARMDNGVLRLDRGDDPPRFVMDDVEHGGPGTAEPIPIIGRKRAIFLFKTKGGIAALLLLGKGEISALK